MIGLSSASSNRQRLTLVALEKKPSKEEAMVVGRGGTGLKEGKA